MKITGIDIDDMSVGQKMNALVAVEVMKWVAVPINHWLPKGKGRGDDNSLWLYNHPKYGESTLSMYSFCPSTDITAALAMEEEVIKMDAHIQVGYVSRLYELLGIPFSKPMPLSTGESLKLIRATPEQRCRAALKAVMNVY